MEDLSNVAVGLELDSVDNPVTSKEREKSFVDLDI